MGEWVETVLADVARGGIQGGPFGSQLHASDYVKDGVPLIMPKNIGRNVFRYDQMDFVSEVDALRLKTHRVQPGDIVVARKGELGRRVFVTESESGWLCGTDCIRIRPDRGRVFPRFLFYYLGLASVASFLWSRDSGSTMPNLNTKSLGELPVRLPPQSVQASIAAVLGALDDKIAVNERIAFLSDELIRQRYLRVANSAEETIAIGDLGELVREAVNADNLTPSENYISLECVPKRNVWLSRWESAESVASSKTRFVNGDVLFGKLRPYFHKVVLALTRGVCSTDILVIRPMSDHLRGWLLASLSSDDVVAYASAVSDGTRMPRVKWSDLAKHEVPWVGDESVSSFNDFVNSISRQIANILTENQTLAQLRDTLLPKLMSGELRVRDAEKMVEDAT